MSRGVPRVRVKMAGAGICRKTPSSRPLPFGDQSCCVYPEAGWRGSGNPKLLPSEELCVRINNCQEADFLDVCQLPTPLEVSPNSPEVTPVKLGYT